MFESPLRSPWHAKSNAIILLEQAESTLKQGPVRLKNQLSRAASMEFATPVAVYRGNKSLSLTKPVL